MTMTRAIQRGATIYAAALAVSLVSPLIASFCAYAGPPFRTDDPEPVEYQHWEVYGFTQSRHVHGDTAGTLPGLELNYGAAPDLQLHLVAPLAFDRSDGSATRFGYGDTELGAKYRFIEEDQQGWRPLVGIFPLLEVPTGNRERGLGTGHTHLFLPLWLQKSFGPWLTYGGGGYWVNPGAGNKNYWFAGWLLQRQVTDDLALGGEIFHATADIVGGKGNSGFNLGGVYDFNAHYHLLFSAGRGVENASDSNEFSYYLALQWTF